MFHCFLPEDPPPLKLGGHRAVNLSGRQRLKAPR